MKTILGWHFSSNGTLLDGRKIKEGEWQKLRINDWRAGMKRAKARFVDADKKLATIEKRRPVMCTVGYHASHRPRMALRYTYGRGILKPTAERVEIRGWVKEDLKGDKFVGTERRVLGILGPNQTRNILLLFACQNVRYELQHGMWDKKIVSKELARVAECEAYLLGNASKPKRPTLKDTDFSYNLIRTVTDGSKYMTVVECVLAYDQRTPKGTLQRLLLKAMEL